MSEATANLCTTDAAEAMRVTIDEQAREIERLHEDYNEACEDAMSVARELAALKAQPCGVVQAPFELLNRYVSDVEAHNYGFDGDTEIRLILDAARLNSSPVSAAPSAGSQGGDV